MKYIFILNNFGNKEPSFIIERIKIVCESLNLDYIIELNNENCSTEDILKKYQTTENIIIAVGGDGMINRIVNGIANTNNILGYIPYGTGNDFHKTVTETITNEITPIDLIKINNKYFINIACFGIDADIANDEKIIHNKLIPKSQRYNLSVIYHFLKYKARHLELLIDNEIIKNEYETVVLTNGRYYGGGYKIGTNSIITDGLIEAYLFPKMPRLKMANAILSMNKGKHEYLKELTKYQTNQLQIKSEEPIRCNLDGEILESDIFNIEVIPSGIKLYNNPELIKRILK